MYGSHIVFLANLYKMDSFPELQIMRSEVGITLDGGKVLCSDL